MDIKCLLSRTKEIKMPKEMEKRIVEKILNLSNSFSDNVQDSGRMANKEGEKSGKIFRPDLKNLKIILGALIKFV